LVLLLSTPCRIKEGYLIFAIDEIGFSTEDLRRKSWNLKGKPNIHDEPVLNNRISMLVAISDHEITGLTIRFGSFNQFAFAYFIDNFIKHIEKHTIIPKDKWVFVLDNAGIHTSYMIINRLLQTKIKFLFTAPYHPGCNPVEHMFADFKRDVRSQCPSTK